MYSVGGYFEDTNQEFAGTVVVVPFDIGTFNVATLDGTTVCSGNSHGTDRPSSFSLIGAKGYANATCTDGRTFKVDFLQTTETGGHGRGIDNQGNIVRLYFNTSSDLAASQTRREMLQKLMK